MLEDGLVRRVHFRCGAGEWFVGRMVVRVSCAFEAGLSEFGGHMANGSVAWGCI